MIKLLGNLDKKKRYWVGVSGGADSMAAYYFLKQMKYQVSLVFVNHGTEACRQAHAFMMRKVNGVFRSDVFSVCYDINPSIPKNISKEEHWRNERYRILNKLDGEVIVAHHLDDVVETWVHSSLHGQSKLIPYRHGNVIRPFLATPKAELIKWCVSHNIEWIEDYTNADINHQRNYIRHTMMPHILKINPGIGTMLRKKLLLRGVE